MKILTMRKQTWAQPFCKDRTALANRFSLAEIRLTNVRPRNMANMLKTRAQRENCRHTDGRDKFVQYYY